MKEQNILKSILLRFAKTKTKIFRNNVGVGWAGKSINIRSKRSVTVFPGDVVIRQARPLRAGLCKGSSDLIGWTERKITTNDVGRTFAIFTAVEVKTEKGAVRPEQVNFLEKLNDSGGFGGIARSENDAIDITDK